MKKPMGRGVPAHRTVHESYTNFLKICIFAVARADTKSAKKRMVVRFFERRRQCVKCGEMGVIVPVVSTTRKTTQQGGLFAWWRLLRRNRPECTPQLLRRRWTRLCRCVAVGAGILYAAPAERRIHSCLRFYSFFGFRTRILTSTQIAFAI